MSNTSLCIDQIPSNPDVDGIGIRLATYLQLFIGITTLAISPSEGIDSWWAVIITSLGLQIAAVVDHRDLSLYHALVVTWLTFPVFMMTFYYGFLSWGKRKILMEVLVGAGAHISLFTGFCMWVWATAPTFGVNVNNKQCNDEIKFVFFAYLRPTGWFRYLALYIIGIWTFAILSMTIALISLSLILLGAKFNPSIRQWFESTPTPKWKHEISLNTSVAVLSTLNLASLILAIINVELMVIANGSIVQGGNSQWTLGQIAAMLLVAGPLMNLWRIVRREWAFGLGDEDSLKVRPAAAFVAKVLGRRRTRLDSSRGRANSECSEDGDERQERLERISSDSQRAEAGLLRGSKGLKRGSSDVEVELEELNP